MSLVTYGATGFDQGDFNNGVNPPVLSVADGNVLTIESPYTDGWVEGFRLVKRCILEFAQTPLTLDCGGSKIE